MNATTSCTNFNPVIFDGTAPSSSADFWNFSSSSCTIEFSGVASTSNGFTYGEAVNSILLFSILVVVAYWSMVHWLTGTKLKKEH